MNKIISIFPALKVFQIILLGAHLLFDQQGGPERSSYPTNTLSEVERAAPSLKSQPHVSQSNA